MDQLHLPLRVEFVGALAGVRRFAAAAADIDAFCQALVPEPCADATLQVLSTDGKGEVMRPRATRPRTRFVG